MRIPVMHPLERNSRIEALVDRLECLEAAMVDTLSAILEVSDPNDESAVEARRVLELLDQ